MDKTYYRGFLIIKERLHSNVYEEVPLDSDKKVIQKLKSLLEKYRSYLTKGKLII